MKSQNRNLLIVGLIIALVIGIMSPFISSSNPDGLQKSTEELNPNIKDPGYYNAPLAGYKFPGLGDNPLAGIIALIIGALVVFALAYVISIIIKKNKSHETSENMDEN